MTPSSSIPTYAWLSQTSLSQWSCSINACGWASEPTWLTTPNPGGKSRDSAGGKPQVYFSGLLQDVRKKTDRYGYTSTAPVVNNTCSDNPWQKTQMHQKQSCWKVAPIIMVPHTTGHLQLFILHSLFVALILRSSPMKWNVRSKLHLFLKSLHWRFWLKRICCNWTRDALVVTDTFGLRKWTGHVTCSGQTNSSVPGGSWVKFLTFAFCFKMYTNHTQLEDHHADNRR